MSLRFVQDMAKVFRVGAIVRFSVIEAQRLPRFLHEIHQLVHFKEGYDGIHEATKVPVHQYDQRCAAFGYLRRIPDSSHRPLIGLIARLVDDDLEVGNIPQRVLDPRTHQIPVETAKPTPQGWDGDRSDLARLDLAG